MSILSRTLNKEDCNKWNIHKNINPITNTKISPNSHVFKEIKSQCSKLIDHNSNIENKTLSRELLLEDCILWSKNKNMNPITKNLLKEQITFWTKELIEKILSKIIEKKL